MNTKNLSTKFLAASLAALISVPQIPVSVSAADLKSVSIAGNTYSYSAEALDGYTQIGNSGVYYALTDGTKLSGNLYGTSNLTYKEFYSGDVSSTDNFDVVTTATTLKAKVLSNAWTDYNEETTPDADGYHILGVSNVNVAVDSDLYVEASILKNSGKELTGAYEEASDITLNENPAEAPAQYKTLKSDGSYVSNAKIIDTVTDATASLATASFVPAFGDMASTTLFKFDFRGFAEIGWFTAITLIITFCIIDMFDTIGTLVGTASRAGMLDKNGKMPNMKQALLSDAVGTVAGSLTGTSTVTTFVESASGVEAGGRTGLTALTTGIMFLACIFIAPIAGIIPAAATSSALIYVGVLMVAGLKNVDFDDICQSLPVALMMIAMPISGSIGHAIGLGLITYTVIKVFTGKAKDVSVLTYVLSLIFLLKFFIVA